MNIFVVFLRRVGKKNGVTSRLLFQGITKPNHRLKTDERVVAVWHGGKAQQHEDCKNEIYVLHDYLFFKNGIHSHTTFDCTNSIFFTSPLLPVIA